MRIQGGVLGVKPPTLFGNFFQFTRVFYGKNPKTPSKFSLSYKNISKPLPRKISEYAPDGDQRHSHTHIFVFIVNSTLRE